MITALTAGSRFQPFSTAAISARIGVSQALSFHGLFSVTVPMAAVTSVMMTALLMGNSLQVEKHIEGRSLRLSNAGLNDAACSASMRDASRADSGNHEWQIGARDCAGWSVRTHPCRWR